MRASVVVRRFILLLLFAGLGVVGMYVGARHPGLVDRLLGRPGAPPTDVAEPSATLWTCGMHPQVLQDHPGTCPICGMELVPQAVAADDVPPPGAKAVPGDRTSDRKIAYWWDPMMNPPYLSNGPGKSPMGMDLIPVYEDEVSAGSSVTIDPVVVQNMGLRTAEVTVGDFSRSIRSVGFVRPATTRTYEVNVKVAGWVERLHADVEGAMLEKGAPLFELYSPDLVVAQSELQAALRARARLPSHAAPSLVRESDEMVETARRKFSLWDLGPEQVDELARADRPGRSVTVRSPIRGVLLSKKIVQGSAVEPGQTLLEVADLGAVWMDAQVDEMDLRSIVLGQKATAAFRALPGRPYEGTVTFIDPRVDAATRKGLARLEFDNADRELKPGMYATVEIAAPTSDRGVIVPLEAVIDTGTRQIAFVMAGNGRFDPRDVTTGRQTGDGRIEVLKGLAPGETVVVSGQFLLEAESRTQEAIRKMLDARRGAPSKAPAPSSGHEGHGGAAAEVSPQVRVETPAPRLGAPTTISDLLAAYLALGDALAADEERGADTGAEAFSTAASSFEIAGDEPTMAALESLRLSARATVAKPLGERRRAYADAGPSLLRLLDVDPHGRHVAKDLLVVHCSMFPGTWIQAKGAVRNPFYGKAMPLCGEATPLLSTLTDR